MTTQRQRFFLFVFSSVVSTLACGSETDAPEKAMLQLSSAAPISEISKYFANRYFPSDVVHAFTTEFGDDVDCIPFLAQPALRRPEMRGYKPQLAPTNPVSIQFAPPASGRTRITFDIGYRGYDEHGRVRKCPPDTVAMKHYSETMHLGFTSLKQVFAKQPTDIAPRIGSTQLHQEVIAGLHIDNWGVTGGFILWNPSVDRYNEFSLEQLISYGTNAGALQTVEAGLQVYPTKYGDSATRFFIYSTTDNYNTGCYNNECGNFIQTPGTFCLGCAVGPYSIQNGQHYYIDLATWKDGDAGNWWINFADHWIGFFPRDNFHNPGLWNSASDANFFGEIIDQNGATLGHTKTDMGNGVFPGAGDAAEIVWMQDYPRYGSGFVTQNSAYFGSDDRYCYDGVAPSYNTGDHEHFYLGGPGYNANCQ